MSNTAIPVIQHEKNLATLRSWVEEASGGFLTVSDKTFEHYITLVRTDGKAWDNREGDGGGPITGYIVDIYVPQYGKLDRRNKEQLHAVRKHVQHMLVVMYRAQDPDLPNSWGYALAMFEIKNHLR